MNRLLKKSMFVLFTFAGLSLLINGAQAQQEDEFSPDIPLTHEKNSQQIQDYWTPEMMEKAKPMPIPSVVESHFETTPMEEPLPEGANPGYAPGWPGFGPQPEADDAVEITPDHPLYIRAVGSEQPGHGPMPSNPLVGPYGPFQRWTWFGRYLTYPTSVHGKLFFRLNGGNYVCSATVIHRNTLITAGHCNSDGNGTFATNRLFCPSYNAGGVNPSTGCWSVVNSKTSSNWHNNGDPDYDYACLVTSRSGTIINDSIGNVTSWAGRAWNFSARQMEMTFGYPSAPPFAGHHIVTVAAPEWYEYHFRPGGQISKFIGSDSTPGLSGGSWILGMEHRSAGYPDTDGNIETDPGNQWVNGVNSHRRCLVNCDIPPTNTSGAFWQEWSSPPFRRTAASDESEDIIAVCFDIGGT